MTDVQIYMTMVVFGSVILAIAFDLIDMAVAALLGVSMLFGFNILAEEDVIAAVKTAGGPLALLFGGMVVARTLAGTGIFDRIGTVYLRATKGSGKRFLLLLIALVAPLCAFLPNATTVILLAPIIIRVAVALDIDFVGPIVLTAIVSNSAGLFSLLVLIPLLPLLMPDLWRLRRPLPPRESEKPFQRPWFALLALTVLAIMVGLFLVGEGLPIPIGPPAVAIIAASLALLVIYSVKFEPVDNVLRDIDWKTLVFLRCIFF